MYLNFTKQGLCDLPYEAKKGARKNYYDIKEKNLYKADLQSFDTKIGQITNYSTRPKIKENLLNLQELFKKSLLLTCFVFLGLFVLFSF